MTQDELVAELRLRFGDDPANWAFVCPRCGDVASAADFRVALSETGRADESASDHLGQICIGRILGALDRWTVDGTRASRKTYAGRGCDWCAFGLFRGPMIVVTPEGNELYAFNIAPRNGDQHGQ
jgi:hypothetical protein